jgi:phosphoribosyl-ATP pyrophosphohydrolase/phosphoribosyl-AMP cyclohydrolase
MAADCDGDALLVRALPQGPTCHTGAQSCFSNSAQAGVDFLAELYALLASRKREEGGAGYTNALLSQGRTRIAQKVGEEGVEVVIAGLTGDSAELIGESADLLYHLMVLFVDRDIHFSQVIDCLKSRNLGARADGQSACGGLQINLRTPGE